MTATVDTFSALRRELDLATVAREEGLAVTRFGGGVAFGCPLCGRGARDRSGARARDGVTWRCVRCGAGGDVVDLLAATRRVDPRAARRIACDLAGLGGRPGRPPSAPRAPDTTRRPTHLDVIEDLADLGLDGAERDARVWAIGVAAYHYRALAGLDPVPDDPDDVHDWPSPRDHVEYVADVAGRPRTWRHDLLGARAVAIEYLNARLGEAAADVAPYVAELVGVCPTADTGLVPYLRHLRGDAGVDAARRAGLVVGDREHFGGRVVYTWHDTIGRVVYLTARAVPNLDLARAKSSKALALAAPGNNRDGVGVPAPTVPYGAVVADRRDGPTLIVEGELDAVHGLAAGACVATGGTGRMGGRRGAAALRSWLGGRDAVVYFDLDDDPVKRAATDRRAADLAAAIGAQVARPDADGGVA